MATRKSRLKRDVTEALRRNSTATVLMHAAIAARLGLGPADHKCLDLLVRGGSMSAGELAEQTGLTTGAITGVIDRLERGGYVVRKADPADRRRVLVEPRRGKGKALASLRKMFGALAEVTSVMLDRYSADELELILRFLNEAEQLVNRHTATLRNR